MDRYEMTTENYRYVDLAMDAALHAARQAIRDSDERAERASTLTAGLLLGAKMELSLARSIFEPGGLAPNEQQEIHAVSAQHERWLALVDLGFRRRHGVSRADEASLGPPTWMQYSRLVSVFTDELIPVIQARNKLAHGQWIHVMSGKGKRNDERSCLLDDETSETISIKNGLVNRYRRLVVSLVTTRVAFERDFERDFSKFLLAAESLRAADYERYRAEITRRHETGKRLREANRRRP